jgi:FHA domain
MTTFSPNQLNSVDACPRCRSTNNRRYSPVNIRENLLSLLSIYPYQCQHYTCQHRFYRRVNRFAANQEDITISSVSENLYRNVQYAVEDNRHLVNPEVLSKLYEPKELSTPLTKRSNQSPPPIVSNVTHYDFRPQTSVICRKFLILTWRELGKQKIHTIASEGKNGDPNRLKLGRDPSRCDLIFADQTVSGLNAEIYFDDRAAAFYIRNLRPVNPPFINGNKVVSSTCLESSTTLYLGKVAIAIEVELDYYDLEPTILFDHQEHSA